jgi:serpin B
MKTKYHSVTVLAGGLVAALCLLGGQSRADMTTNEQELAAANAGFAFNLLQQITATKPGTNIFISPYSVSTALQMVSAGAEGTTRTEMQQVLGTIDMTQSNLDRANRKLIDLINSKNADFILDTANALWYRSGTPIKQSFIETDETYFGARVEGLNFNKPSAAKSINAWASEETHGKITQIVTPPIAPDISLFLANAVYFLGKWETPFPTNNTTNMAFYPSGGGQTNVPMMQQTGGFNYCEGSDYQAVQLPYKGGDLAMYVFLPGTNSSPAALLGEMSGSWWQAAQTNFSGQGGTVILPKFTLHYAVDLVQSLEALGMTNVFTPEADLAGISRWPMFISDVKQQAYVDVDEKGTEATAVTTISVGCTAVTGIPPQPFQMTVDRPFLFLIADQQAGTILFMGAVYLP